MENVPKIVTQRLGAQAVPMDHPDADLLTAFAEHSLPEGERNRVFEHLASCRDCRDVVALALPDEAPMIEVVQPARETWLSWPRLRWGLVAAGVIVVGSFGVLHYRSASNSPTVAMYNAPRTDNSEAQKQSALPAAPESQPQTPPSTPSVNTGVVSNGEPESTTHFDRLQQFGTTTQPMVRDEDKAARARTVYGSVRGQAPHGPKPPSQFQQNSGMLANNTNSLNYPAPVPAPPASASRQQSANQSVAAEAAPAAAGANVGGPIKQRQGLDTLAQNRPIEQVGAAGAEVARAKPAEPALTSPQKKEADNEYSLPVNSRNLTQLASLAPETVRWSITDSGGLQRSLDQGKTWEDVDVNRALEASDAGGMQYAMKSARRPAAKDKADRKQVPIVFRAVAANGPDVWAGGSGGYLYHSVDSGAHWMRIQPSWGGIDLTGDVLNLQFFDVQHGRVVTSTAEIWTTADAGESWEKQ
ncbi:MAG TPA: YCF48-related protein [Dongiaceae bacterium]|nr:YCF48-related protein [Dongiaceae bacterium]